MNKFIAWIFSYACKEFVMYEMQSSDHCINDLVIRISPLANIRNFKNLKFCNLNALVQLIYLLYYTLFETTGNFHFSFYLLYSYFMVNTMLSSY